MIGNLAVAAKLNREYEGLVRFETVLWEEHFYTADKSFQPQIPEAVASDIVVSIFWTRIGTEPPADFPRMANGKPYPSGTAYELLTALEASKAKGVPDVYVFRKIADGTLPIDAERRRQAQTQLDALEAFWSEWFRSQTGEFKAAFQNFRRRMHSNSSLSSCCGSGSRRGAYSARGSLGRRKRVRRFRDWRRSRLSMRGHGWNFRKGQRAPQPDSEQFRSSPGRRSATVDRVV